MTPERELLELASKMVLDELGCTCAPAMETTLHGNISKNVCLGHRIAALDAPAPTRVASIRASLRRPNTEPLASGGGAQMSEDTRLVAAQFLMRHNLRPGWHSQPCKGCEELTDSLAELLASIHAQALEEVAQFAETHYCVIDWERGRDQYKVERREKHPCEPLAMAIRALASRPTPAPPTKPYSCSFKCSCCGKEHHVSWEGYETPNFACQAPAEPVVPEREPQVGGTVGLDGDTRRDWETDGPALEKRLESIVAQLNYYAEFGFTGDAHDSLYQAALAIHNAGFELAHESAKCGHARANYRDPNYKKGDTECDCSKCEFCEALAAAPRAAGGQREVLQARAAECDSLRLFLHISRDHIPLIADDCKFQVCVDLKARADAYLELAATEPQVERGGKT